MSTSKVKKILRQFLAFGGISGIGWCLDFAVYTLLNPKLGAVYSNMISSAVGVSFVFWVSTRRTFANNIHRLSLPWKYVIYLLYQCCAITLASVAIGGIEHGLQLLSAQLDIGLLLKYSYILAKILVTPFTLIINFVVMKILVEKI